MWRGEPVYKNVSAPATAGQALATFAAWVQLVTTSYHPSVFIFTSSRNTARWAFCF
jgi:hypothetical protein